MLTARSPQSEQRNRLSNSLNASMSAARHNLHGKGRLRDGSFEAVASRLKRSWEGAPMSPALRAQVLLAVSHRRAGGSSNLNPASAGKPGAPAWVTFPRY